MGICSHPTHRNPVQTSGTVITASSSYTVDGRGVARLGDTVITACGHEGIIVTATAPFTTDSRPIARIGDSVCGFFDGKITGGSSESFS